MKADLHLMLPPLKRTLCAVCAAIAGFAFFAAPATASFDMKGTPDILWQNMSTGQVVYWFMKFDSSSNAYTMLNYLSIPTTQTQWRIAGVADIDFNESGTPDLIWQDLSQPAGLQEIYWIMGYSGSAYTWNGNYTFLGDQGVNDGQWKLIATPTLFSTDGLSPGNPCFVYQNQSSGQIGYATATYFDSGAYQRGGITVCATPEPGFNLVAVADVNDDGVPDLLLQNPATGEVDYLLMADYSGRYAEGSGATQIEITPNPGPSWTLVGAPDIDGYGIPDLLWRNYTTGTPLSGDLDYWLMSYTTTNGYQMWDNSLLPPSVSDPNWKIVATPFISSNVRYENNAFTSGVATGGTAIGAKGSNGYVVLNPPAGATPLVSLTAWQDGGSTATTAYVVDEYNENGTLQGGDFGPIDIENAEEHWQWAVPDYEIDDFGLAFDNSQSSDTQNPNTYYTRFFQISW